MRSATALAGRHARRVLGCGTVLSLLPLFPAHQIKNTLDGSVRANFKLCAGEIVVEICNTSGYSLKFRLPSTGESSPLPHTTDGSMRTLARFHQNQDLRWRISCRSIDREMH